LFLFLPLFRFSSSYSDIIPTFVLQFQHYSNILLIPTLLRHYFNIIPK
jgi:hypothetical protein